MFRRDKVRWIRVETLGQYPNKYDFDPSRLRKHRQPIKAGKWRDIQKQMAYLYQSYIGTFIKI